MPLTDGVPSAGHLPPPRTMVCVGGARWGSEQAVEQTAEQAAVTVHGLDRTISVEALMRVTMRPRQDRFVRATGMVNVRRHDVISMNQLS